ncbi:STAS domain-containing protein [Immundisolibacter sp.]|jgi:phospholipid transport system transporter-binding protein
MIKQEDGTIRFSGPLTMSTVNGALLESTPLFAQDGPWDLDLSGVNEVDSAAVSLLLEWVRQAARHGRKLHIKNLPENLQCLVKVYGVKELLPAA